MRDRAIVGIACLAAAIIAPWLLVIQPKRAQASKLQSQINSEQAQLSSVRSQLAAGNAARAAFASSYSTLIRLGEAVPTDDNTPSLIYQLQSAAKAARVNFQTLTFNAGQGGTSASSSAAPASPAGSSSSSSASSSKSSSASSASTLPPGATVGPAGFPIEPFTFTFDGNFFHLANFLGRLQRFVVATNRKLSVSGRLMTLDAITLADSGSFPQITATISATTYLLPSSQGLLNGATPSGPAPSTTQTVSNTSPTSSLPPAVVTDSPVR
jgi:type II secretory pathway pseudopilin PulG